LVRAGQAELAAEFNDALLRVGLAYLDLLAAHQQVAIAQDAVKNARELARLVDSHVRAGAAPRADGLRIQAELADRQRHEQQAQEAVRVASAELVRLLRLDPLVTLVPAEPQPVPIHLIDPAAPLPALLEQGLVSRPELARHQALVAATLEQLRQEKWRPWLPAVQLGYSGGGFGGGEGGDLTRFGGRSDFDALLVWELRNLGLGNRALRRDRASQQAQASLTAEQVRDRVAAEVVRAYRQVQHRLRQVDLARTQLRAASEALPLNFKGIPDRVLRVIEAQQAVQALAAAQANYLTAVIEYNQAQFQLLRAIGRPLAGGPGGTAVSP
jgi:outer membrane protein TolC